MKELVSVIMSTYNENESQLSTSIESILNQSYEKLEFIIVNDNPKNEQLGALLAKYAQLDKRIVIVENPQNMGLVNSLNRALSYTKGDYIARMDADDISRPERLQLQLQYMKENRLDFVGGYAHFINEEGSSLGHIMKAPATNEQICRAVRWGNCIPHPTWFVRKEVYEKLGGYRHIPHAEDFDFILRALKTNFRFGNVPCVVLDYRIRSSGISVSNGVEQNLVRYYLTENRQKITEITEEMVAERIADRQNPYYLYHSKADKMKRAIKNKNLFEIGICGCRLVMDKYFWLWFVEKIRYRLSK